MSALNIYNYSHYNFLTLSVLVSLIGIASTVLFFLKKSNFFFLAIIWIFAQIPFLITDSFAIDFCQAIHFHNSLKIGSFKIGINPHILLLLFIKPILLSKFLHKTISFKAFSDIAELKRDEEYIFSNLNIINNKLISLKTIQLNTFITDKIVFSPKENTNLKKASIILSNSTENKKVSGTIIYTFKTSK